jgi:hypothetical protein
MSAFLVGIVFPFAQRIQSKKAQSFLKSAKKRVPNATVILTFLNA